jgi:hypothetical protein
MQIVARPGYLATRAPVGRTPEAPDQTSRRRFAFVVFGQRAFDSLFYYGGHRLIPDCRAHAQLAD